jgi:Asp-tRNA(Asn)/Glu-tRNA(Gln) amidotransferase A subunit family amidase
MQAVAKPDGRDMSVTDTPFNWNAQTDIRKLRVGYIKESFDEITNATVKANAMALLDTLRSLGVREFIPMTIPEAYTNVSAIGVESAAFFDEFARAGRMVGTRSARPTGRLMSAVDFLQSQRVRMMMMMKLAEVTEGLDVYIVAANNNPGAPPPPRTEGAPDGAPRGGNNNRPQGPAQRHSSMANLACYPAMNVPNGFSEYGSPTNVTFFARPYMENELIALAKAYQDAAGHHLKKPTKLDAAT